MLDFKKIFDFYDTLTTSDDNEKIFIFFKSGEVSKIETFETISSSETKVVFSTSDLVKKLCSSQYDLAIVFHTHPRNEIYPSLQDIKSWNRTNELLNQDQQKKVLFGIVSYCNIYTNKNFNSLLDYDEYYKLTTSRLLEVIKQVRTLKVEDSDYSLSATFLDLPIKISLSKFASFKRKNLLEIAKH